jgi:hypothetical protein
MMAHWRVSVARAKFSALLDAAETEGPQLIRRGKQTFVVATREEIERHLAEARNGKLVADVASPEQQERHKKARTQSARTISQFFRNSPLPGSGIKLERVKVKPRPVEF